MGRILIVILFVGAALIRFADVFRPINKASWRESDLGSISRNFATEEMNLFYPRVDWRGDGPGYAEMELPIFPFLTATGYEIFGQHDQIGRILGFIFSLGALFFFYRLAREYLSPFAAVVAFSFFALNPLIVDTSTSIQPEGFMLMAYIAAVLFFIRWLKNEGTADYIAAIGATAIAILAKAPAAHIGLLFGVLVLEKYGLAVIKEWKVWLLGIFAILPGALWYFHAKNLWLTYGNSLGVSNEYHWIGLDFFTDPNFIEGILRNEFVYVWLFFGVLVGAFAILRGYREDAARQPLLWLASIFALYLLAARTTSADWANYYHVFSIPPVALIFGLSIEKLWEWAHDLRSRYSQRAVTYSLLRASLLPVVVISILASLGLEAKQVRANFYDKRAEDPSLLFAQKIRGELTNPGLILVSGGHCYDSQGYALAYNASFMFYWLERKGWNICIEEQSADRVASFGLRGAKYFVAQKPMLDVRPGLTEQLRSRYRIVDESDDFYVFDLTSARAAD